MVRRDVRTTSAATPSGPTWRLSTRFATCLISGFRESSPGERCSATWRTDRVMIDATPSTHRVSETNSAGSRKWTCNPAWKRPWRGISETGSGGSVYGTVPIAEKDWARAGTAGESISRLGLSGRERMDIRDTDLPGVKLIRPAVFGDERGWFLENWRDEEFADAGIHVSFSQVNTSHSRFGVLRGLHYQWPEPQGKLVWVTAGRVFDVAVDIRTDSSKFGRWTAVELSAENHHQLWIPEGFAHGFQVLSEQATFSYLCTRPYRPASLSAKDTSAPGLEQIDKERLPTCESC